MFIQLLLVIYHHVLVSLKNIFIKNKKKYFKIKGPDYAKGHLCKHIIFVLHRVLKVSRNSPLIYQQALLTNELNEIFTKADSQNNDTSILAEQPVRKTKIYLSIN
jgi:hypothetical protein